VILTLLGKPDCHLCHEMHEVVAPVAAELGLTLVERDVGEDPELKRRYALDIPVLLAGEVEVARHRTSADELRRRLAALTAAG
jgi:glutaredoxin-like protein DUF836